jgi:hypothetical protein
MPTLDIAFGRIAPTVAVRDLLYDHLVANGARIIKGLRDADYGLRNFVFADPDGNRIDVGQEL